MATATAKKATKKKRRKAPASMPPGKPDAPDDEAKGTASGKKAKTTKKAATKRSPPTKADGAQLEALHTQAEKCAEARARWEESKAETADLRKTFDAEMATYLSMGLATHDEGGLLRRMEPDGWIKEPIESCFGSATRDHEVLRAEGLTTVGKLVKWLEDNRFADLNGVGPERSARMADALGRFWKHHPQWAANARGSGDEE